jgi:hypothetical protein
VSLSLALHFLVVHCSLSHYVYVYMCMYAEGKEAARHHSRTARLRLVDLAGSESTAAAHDGAADKAGECVGYKGIVCSVIVYCVIVTRQCTLKGL